MCPRRSARQYQALRLLDKAATNGTTTRFAPRAFRWRCCALRSSSVVGRHPKRRHVSATDVSTDGTYWKVFSSIDWEGFIFAFRLFPGHMKESYVTVGTADAVCGVAHEVIEHYKHRSDSGSRREQNKRRATLGMRIVCTHGDPASLATYRVPPNRSSDEKLDVGREGGIGINGPGKFARRNAVSHR